LLIKVRGIHKVKRGQADGSTKVHYYAWRGGPKMQSQPNTEAFLREHARLKGMAEQQVKTIDTIETLIDRFTGTEHAPNPDFSKLAASTQADHLYAFRLIRKEWPQLPVKLTQQKGMKAEIRRWHRSFAANPRKADKLLMSLSKLFTYAIADELIEKNPCSGIKQLYEGTRRDIIWSAEQISVFRISAPPHLLLPFEIAIHTGQRQGDILRLVPKQYDGTYLRFTQSKSKGKTRLKVLVHARLKAMLDEVPNDVMRVCLNSRQRPWTSDGFQVSWRRELARLKINQVTFHDLRGTFITERYREGSSIEDIAKISGHSIKDVRAVLEKHYLSPDQDRSDSVIRRMEKNG
jgi:integrase